MNIEQIKESREYAWNYFCIHAEQRLKTFNFFVVLSSVISGATLTITKDLSNYLYAAPMGFLLTFFAFIFWKLDVRNKELIKHGEQALRKIELYTKENNIGEISVNLFLNEEEYTSKKRENSNVYCSYSKCFNLVFLAFGLAGFLAGVFLLVGGYFRA